MLTWINDPDHIHGQNVGHFHDRLDGRHNKQLPLRLVVTLKAGLIEVMLQFLKLARVVPELNLLQQLKHQREQCLLRPNRNKCDLDYLMEDTALVLISPPFKCFVLQINTWSLFKDKNMWKVFRYWNAWLYFKRFREVNRHLPKLK